VKRVRISGLVRLMNQVREGMSTGIPPGEEDNFRRMVQRSVQQVEEICKEYKISPDKLPSPTYRAYRYLKEVDLSVIPVAKERPDNDPGRLRIRNLISACRAVQDKLGGLAVIESHLPVSKKIKNPITLDLRVQIQALVESVEAAIESAGSSEDSLSSQSQRAYRWLRYLSLDKHLEDHIATLRDIQVEIAQVIDNTKSFKRYLNRPIHFELSNLPAIYTVKQTKDGLLVQAHEGFVGAPDRVIKALVMATLSGKDARDKKGKTYLETVKAYTHSAAFRKIASQVDIERRRASQDSRGQHFDLEAIFHKVNQAYFNGEMPKPNLVWNKTLTHRKFGHYHSASDTVMLSISLDRASIPAYVLEFVMYHELLHKQIGTKNHKGRQYAHTQAFREAEAKFPRREQAEAALNRLGRSLLKGKS
jgi:predicted metal-dependent hydrolase